ncbi:MAG: hypothetical protein RI928_463 [Pseudomonadota bacterium]|jgi:hypothetical protein
MARTRRAVESLTALILSIWVSGLLFGSFVLSLDHAQSVPGYSAYSVAIVMLAPDYEKIDLLATEFASEIKDPLGKENSDESESQSPDHAIHDIEGSEAGDYLPVSMLTQRPVVLQDIDPELPEALRSLEPQSFYLTLFVNEYGDVDQVKLASVVVLAPSMIDELRRHFEVMRFMPGYLEGRAVRAALRIRVQLHP